MKSCTSTFLLWFYFGQIQTSYSDTLRPSERPWPLTLDPESRPSDGPDKAHEGLDGSCGECGRHPHPLPANSRRPVLTCASRPGERLACASVCRISLRRGQSYERPCVYDQREERERRHSMQKQHNSSKWICRTTCRRQSLMRHSQHVLHSCLLSSGFRPDTIYNSIYLEERESPFRTGRGYAHTHAQMWSGYRRSKFTHAKEVYCL